MWCVFVCVFVYVACMRLNERERKRWRERERKRLQLGSMVAPVSRHCSTLLRMLTLLHNDPLLQHDGNLLMRRHIGCHPPVQTPAKGIGQTKRPFRRLCDLFYLCSVRNLCYVCVYECVYVYKRVCERSCA